MNDREQSDREGISGGRFVPAANYLLPPVRTYRLESMSGGRFVPAANRLLPPVRTARLQAIGYDPANAYHFGSRVSNGFNRRREDE